MPERPKTALLLLIWFVSGAAGLIFELLWFRLAGLSFGNTVWAATTVLAAFMGGLTLGNALAGSALLRLQRALRWYALLEILIAVSGIALMWLLPMSGQLVAQYGGTPGLHLATAFVLMAIPTTAMGMTLPLLVRALYANQAYGALLGRLYGINTLGALGGVLATEYLLLGWLGVTGSGLFAGGLNLLAAATALWLGRGWPAARETRSRKRYSARLGGRWLLVAFISGALLLALEIVWFRLLLLPVRGTATAFAVMLALVLAGIALGGLLASLYLRRRESGRMAAALAAGFCGCGIIAGYLALPGTHGATAWLPGLWLMCATALGSGLLFTLLGSAYAQVITEPSRATGRLLIANTAGGMLGAALGGLLLLPRFGIETSLLLAVGGYLLCAMLLLPVRSLPVLAWTCACAAAVLLFPHGKLQTHLDAASAPWRAHDQAKLVYQHEGLNETLQLLQRELFGEPLAHRLITNGDSMSGTERDSRRYMKLFAWLPMALHPQIEDVLLISYGLGSTAEALTADPGIRNITVVDISPEILTASRLTRTQAAEPLADHRVQVAIEDGRHFLLTTGQQYDLITGEPPPPRLAGIVNLYTQEYFALMHARLKPGGLASYWLPVDQLTLSSSSAILGAFCSVFPDCSLWAGSNYNWILLGSRGGIAPAPAAQVRRLWQLPAIRADISALGFEHPAQLGATFIADAAQLEQWAGAAAPLTDNRPKRLAEGAPSAEAMQAYAAWLASPANRERFRDSALIRHIWPAALFSPSLDYYDAQPILNNEIRTPLPQRLQLVDAVISATELRIPVFWLLDSGIREQRIVDRLIARSGYRQAYAWHLGVRALAERRYPAAAELFNDYLAIDAERARPAAIYSLCRSGLADQAEQLAAGSAQSPGFRCW